jgi:anti-anti-sigma factor
MDESAPNPNRCLEIAHVLFMDVVAYSTLHMDRQQQLLHNLQEAVRSTPTFARAQAEEQLIRLPTGDGMALVFFHDPEAPVRCAVELAKILRDSPDIKLRMGIHTGPVYRVADINANRNVAGGGINTAQRVMDCGDAGHILVSKAMVDVLGQLECWDCSLYDLGEAEAKHGVRVHIFNLFTGDLGNPKVPNKIRTARAAQKSGIVNNKRTKRSPASSDELPQSSSKASASSGTPQTSSSTHAVQNQLPETEISGAGGSSFRYEVEHSAGKWSPNKVTAIKLHGRPVSENTEEIRNLINTLLARGGRIVIDLSDLSYLDSSGLGTLVGLKVSAINQGLCILQFVNMTPRVVELLSRTGLGQLLSA